MRLTDLFLYSLVVYRITRFIHSDTLIDGVRERFQVWLVVKEKLWADKIYELSTCPYCLSVWIAAGVVAVADRYTSVPLPVFTWLAASGGAMVAWRFTEHPAETVKVKEAKPEDE